MAYNSPKGLVENFAKIRRQAYVSALPQLVHPGKFSLKTAEVFSYDTYNPRGILPIWSILKVFDTTRCFAFWGDPQRWNCTHNFLHLNALDSMNLVVSMKMSCEPEIYDPKVVKQPVEAGFELVYVGNTSYVLRSYIYLPQFKKPLAKKDICFVSVYKDTHRPQKFPDWWKEKYSQYSLPAEKPISFKPFDFAQAGGNVQHENIDVRTTDLDGFCHVNNASFIRFCYEAYIACHVRQFGYTPQADPYQNVKAVSCVFKGEAELRNLLQVSFVQDADNRDTYHFQILKNPGGIIFESCLEFFPQLSSKY